MTARVDLHVHSCYSRFDGMMSPRAIVKLADHHGYDAIAVTDHFTYDGALRGTLATQALAEHAGLTAYTGLEYHVTEGAHRGHVLLYFDHVDQVPERGLDLDSLLDHAQDEGLAVVHPHPFGFAGITSRRLMEAADRIEVNGSYREGPVNQQLYQLAEAEGWTRRLVANSDAHARGQMGSAYTEVETLHRHVADTLATTVDHAIAEPRRAWGRAAKIARAIAQPVGLAMNAVQRLVTNSALEALPDELWPSQTSETA